MACRPAVQADFDLIHIQRGAMAPALQSSDIVAFWRAAGPRKWFARDAGFDDQIRSTFEPMHFAASRGRVH